MPDRACPRRPPHRSRATAEIRTLLPFATERAQRGDERHQRGPAQRELHTRLVTASTSERHPGRAQLVRSASRAIACRECEPWLAAGLGFRDPSRLAALFDDDMTGVDLDDRLDRRFLMTWEHDESARMGSYACVLPDRQVQCSAAIDPDALAYEGVGRLSVAWTLILDPVVYASCQGLVLRHTALTLIIHSGGSFHLSAIGTDRSAGVPSTCLAARLAHRPRLLRRSSPP